MNYTAHWCEKKKENFYVSICLVRTLWKTILRIANFLKPLFFYKIQSKTMKNRTSFKTQIKINNLNIELTVAFRDLNCN